MATKSIPYSFSTDKTGVHKLELFRIGATVPISIKSVNITVSNIAILQTGTLTLESLDSDNYKLYVYKLLEDGTNECIASSNTTLLTCSGDPLNCTKPSFLLSASSPTCSNGIQNADGFVDIKNVVDGKKVKICNGQVWSCDNVYNTATDITANNLFNVLGNLLVSASAESEFYVVRVYKDPSCYLDQVAKLVKPSCTADLCNLNKVYNSQSSNENYYYKNILTIPKTIYMRFEATTPTQFRVFKNGVLQYNTNCSGSTVGTCTSCLQGGVVCGKIELQANDNLEVKIDSTCSGASTATWKFKTSCNPIGECLTVIEFGKVNVCGITQPTDQILYICDALTSTVKVEMAGYYGSISGEYQFGYDVNNIWQTASEVVWENSGVKTGVPKDKNISIWVRDKNNTGCFTVVNVKTPSCVFVRPTYNQKSILQIFNQTGNIVKVSADSIVSSHKYRPIYNYTDETFVRGGTFNTSTKETTYPLIPRKGTIGMTLHDTTDGSLSNVVYFNVLDEVVLLPNTPTNIAKPSDPNTYLKLGFNRIESLLPYVVEVRDANTSAILYTKETSDPVNFELKHDEISTDVTIQVWSKGNSLKGSQLINFKLEKQEPTTINTLCCPEKVAYFVNAVNTGSTPDSIGIYYKDTQCPHRIKLYEENQVNRGQYDLYFETTYPSQAVVLSPPYADYNFRLVQAYASRILRDNNYKFKLEFYDVNNLLKKTIEFTANVTPTSQIGVPYVKYDCTTASNSNCSLVDKELYGAWNASSTEILDVQSRFIQGDWYVAAAERNSTTDKYYPKGLNFIDNSNVVLTKTPQRSCFKQVNTDFGGLVIPANLTPPSGYRQGVTADGAVYFEIGTTDLPYPCNNVGTAYTGAIPSQSGVTVYSKLLYEKINPSLASNSVDKVKGFFTRNEAITLMALYATNTNSVNANGYKTEFDFVVNLRNGQYAQFFAVGDYLLNNNLPPFTLGVAQCGFFVVPAYADDNNVATVYPYADRYKILTVDKYGKIVNIELYIVNVNTPIPPTGNRTMGQIIGVPPVYQGIINVQATKQTNTDLLNISIKSRDSNDRIELQDSRVNNSVPSGRVRKYMIDTRGNGFYDSLDGLFFEPYSVVLISKFHVDPNLVSYPENWENNLTHQATSIIIFD